MRRRSPLFAATLLAIVAVRGVATPTVGEALADDASLHAVAAFNAGRAWAVGDRGVALRTVDGGQTWTPGATPTDARLEGVWFLDDRRGWAVGGSIRPHTHESRGVVLRTIDGGAQWESIAVDPIPRLRAIRMFDADNGVAAGDSGPLGPSGVFTTDNGGRNWRPVASPEGSRWSGAAFASEETGGTFGLLVGESGAATLADRRVARRRAEQGADVALTDRGTAWLVGNSGKLRVSHDRGETWSDPPSSLPRELNDWFDWRAVAAEGSRVIAVGAPGAVALRTDDHGASWSASPTGVTTPLNAVAATPDGHGWAVGDYGVIVATRDGGATWAPQRGAERRAAALVCVATPEQLPCEWLAVAATAEGSRIAIGCPLDHGERTNDRLAEAASALGVCATMHGYEIELGEREHPCDTPTIKRLLDDRSDVAPVDAMARGVARWIVSHRPETVVLPTIDGTQRGAAQVLREAVEEGIGLAATVAPDLGVTPWRPRRLLEVRPLDTEDKTPAGARRLTTGRFVSGLGGSPEQHARKARGLIQRHAATPDAYAWSAIDGTPLRGGRGDAPLDDLGLRRDSEARRPLTVTPRESIEQLRRVAQKQRRLRALLARDGGDLSDWSGQTIELTGGLDAASGAALLAELADGYRRAGRPERAAETLYLLARRYPAEPRADAAIVALVRHYASGERAHAANRTIPKHRTSQPLANVDQGVALTAYEPTAQPAGLSTDDRLERATRLATFLEQARPALFASAAVIHQSATVDRRSGRASAAERAMLLQSATWVDGPWRRAAAAERWLADRDSPPPEKPIAACRRTERRPLLDGDLGESCWADADAIHLAGDGETTVRLLRDDGFLFLAIEAEADPASTEYRNTPRPRDADLSGRDRVRVRIDLDRDYVTAWELTVDRRGWTHDALAGDPLWNPAWYVAAAEGNGGWRVEAAVPLDELCEPSAATDAVWAVSIDRVCPGRGSIVWGDPRSDPDSPDAFGLLMID